MLVRQNCTPIRQKIRRTCDPLGADLAEKSCKEEAIMESGEQIGRVTAWAESGEIWEHMIWKNIDWTGARDMRQGRLIQ